MTGEEIITGIRMLIHEATAKFWTLEEVILSANMAFRYYVSQLSYGTGEWYKAIELLDSIVGQQYIDLPDGVQNPKCNGHIDWVSYNKKSLATMLSEEMIPGDEGPAPEKFCLLHKKLYLYPFPTVVYPINLCYWFVPDFITDANKAEEIDFPDEIAPVIVFDGAINCVLKDEEDIQDLLLQRQQWAEPIVYQRGNRIKMNPYQTKPIDDGLGGL